MVAGQVREFCRRFEDQKDRKGRRMIVEVKYVGDTKTYVKYETDGMDFTYPSVKAKFWIPKGEIQTNIPGVYPESIKIKIVDDSEGFNG